MVGWSRSVDKLPANKHRAVPIRAEMFSATSLVQAAVGETTRHHATCME